MQKAGLLTSPDSEPGTAGWGTALYIDGSSIGITAENPWFEGNGTGTEILSGAANTKVEGGRITANTLGVSDLGFRSHFDGVLVSFNTSNVATGSGSSTIWTNTRSTFTTPWMGFGTSTQESVNTRLTLAGAFSTALDPMLWINNNGGFAAAFSGIGFGNQNGGFANGLGKFGCTPGSGFTNTSCVFHVADAAKALQERARFDVFGNFGVGTTSPWAKLATVGNATSTAPTFVIASSTGAVQAVVNWNGYVGIGTSSPYSMLSVAGTTTAAQFEATSTNSTSTFAGGLSVGMIKTTGATSTFANGLNLLTGCIAYNGTCLSTGGGLSGGTNGMLASWTSASSLTATSVPTVRAINATTTTATSSFAGRVLIGTTTNAATSGISSLLEVNSSGNELGSSFGAIYAHNDSTDGGAFEFRLDAPVADIEFVESDQDGSTGKGKFEIAASGNELCTGTRNLANSAFDRLLCMAQRQNGGQVGIGTEFDTKFLNSMFTIASTSESSALDYFHISLDSDNGGDIFNVKQNKAVGISTTSPWAKLAIVGTATTTSPAFVVASSTGTQLFTVDRATSTFFTDLKIDSTTGELVIPVASNPSVTLPGEIALDTSSSSLRAATSSNSSFDLYAEQFRTFTYGTTTTPTGSTTIALAGTPRAITYRQMGCLTNNGGSAMVQIGDGTASSTGTSTSNGLVTIYNTLATNNQFGQGEAQFIQIGNPTGSWTQVTCTFGYYNK